jgi:hypothetical protein
MTGRREQEAEVEDSDSEAPGEQHVETPGQKEIGGPEGPEPTRFGDWERAGRCVDF